MSRLLIGALLAAIGTSAFAAFGDLNMPVGVTPISREAYELHMLILIICVIIGIIVFGMMFISILKHRKSLGHEPAQFYHSTKAEIIWTVIPCVILVALAVPATNALIKMEDTSEAAITLKVTGYQWKWKYEYLEDGVTVYSNLAPSSRAAIYEDPRAVDHYLRDVDQRVVLPVGKKIRLLLTADDVIHAWWVPDLGMKKDAIPGFINEMWIKIDEDKTGVYRGQCAELCGVDHGFMPIVVEARNDEGYKLWVAERKAAMAAEKVAANELEKPAKVAPEAQAAATVESYSGPLSGKDLLAVVSGQRNAFGSQASHPVQPSIIAAARSESSGGF
ncbi:MAG: cytochrome c oxidase subunit II [Gammaproteobacteria bacterium]|nr:cytochrome c oxidase subunit II [Gammaproteobacteria bacterium]